MKEHQAIEIIRESPLFDAEWYRATYPDVAQLDMDPARHYLLYGGPLGRAASPDFCGQSYLDANQDVANAGHNPLLHYLQLGQAEGRKAFPVQEHSAPAHKAQPAPESAPRSTNNATRQELEAQLAETQRLLEHYFARCQTLEYQRMDETA